MLQSSCPHVNNESSCIVMQQTTTYEITSEPTQFDNPRTLALTTKNLAFNGGKIWRIPQ